MKKIMFFTLSATISLFALSNITNNSITTKKINFTYENGFWWYNDKVKDENNKTKIVKVKISPLEKIKIENNQKVSDAIREMLAIQKANLEVNKKILKKLTYAFPNTTPKYGIDSKGKKCVANSSSDCFVMPLIAEAQHLPVLKKFLRNPSPENAKDWLKWQSRYFNELDRIGNGLHFAYLKGGSDVYNTDTQYATGDDLSFSQSERLKGVREYKILSKHKDQISYLIFMGATPFYEQLMDSYRRLGMFQQTFMKDMNYAIVFPSKKAFNEAMSFIKNTLGNKEGERDIIKFYENAKMVVRPDLYKKYHIIKTPTVYMFYTDKSGKKVKNYGQPLSLGNIEVQEIRRKSIDYLRYLKVLDPKELAETKYWNEIGSDKVMKDKVKLPNFKKPINFKKQDIINQYFDKTNEKD